MFPDRQTRSFLDTGVLSRLAGFPLFSRKPMLGSVSGRHPSPHRGSSVEFAEYRKYVPGDDLRRLDWRAYGRSDRFFVKEFEADTNLRCCLLLDTSGSMEFGSTGITKMEYARRIAGTIGQLALQQGDAVGLTCMADGIVRNIPPRRNPSHLMAIFDVLEQARLPPADAVPRHGGRPVDLRRAQRDRRALSQGDQRLPRGAPAGGAGVGRRLSPGVDRRIV
jgi:uncharacterized protein (DUF58 family)